MTRRFSSSVLLKFNVILVNCTINQIVTRIKWRTLLWKTIFGNIWNRKTLLYFIKTRSRDCEINESFQDWKILSQLGSAQIKWTTSMIPKSRQIWRIVEIEKLFRSVTSCTCSKESELHGKWKIKSWYRKNRRILKVLEFEKFVSPYDSYLQDQNSIVIHLRTEQQFFDCRGYKSSSHLPTGFRNNSFTSESSFEESKG